MSPFINGTIYPELPMQMLDPTELNVLILSPLNADYLMFMSQIKVLHNYVQDRIGNGTHIQIHALKDSKPNMFEHLSVKLHQLDDVKLASINELVQRLDIDLVLDTQSYFSDKDAVDNDSSFKVVRDLDGLTAECEAFLVGRNTPWLFSNATWNMTWLVRYYMRPGLCADAFSFMGEAKQKHGYNDEQVERLRYLTNRIGQIDYCRDMLNAFLQKKRRAFRHGIENQDYNFELNYHLSNYYFLISGGLDILARTLNDVLKLGITGYMGLGLEKKDFIKVLSKSRPDLAKLYTAKKVKEWIEWMKERRNYIAHEAGMYHTPLVQEKEVKMTPEELERKIDEQVGWMKGDLPADVYQAHRDMVANLVKMEDYEEVLSDVMIVQTNGKNKKLFSPLRNIDYDYDHFQDLTHKTIIKLQTAS